MGGCCSAIDAEAIQYVREIAVVLRSLDIDRVKSFYRKWEKPMNMSTMPDDAQLQIDMHKMVLELPALEDMHEASLAYLSANDEYWDVRGNNCSHGCDPGSCGRRETAEAEAETETQFDV